MDTCDSKENGPMPSLAAPRRRRGGFTLIELLVVIAIIAILTAILLPVIFGAKEKARQGIVLDHLRQISDALAKYKLDHHEYPPVLFGDAATGTTTPMSAARPGSGLTGPVGLYPSYINDPSVFTDPNNPVGDDKATTTPALPVNSVNSSGALVQTNATFYAADAYDANPQLNAAKNDLAKDASGNYTYIPRYQRVWTTINPSANSRQLIIPNSPADTFVTCTTYHAGPGIGQGKVIVLFAGGNADVMDDSRFLAGGPDGGPTPTFWQVKP